MSNISSTALQQFKNNVGIKFQLYNSLFTSLPFHKIEKTGILLSLLLDDCEEGYKNDQGPVEIIENFFEKHTSNKTEDEKLGLLFLFIQYVERQVVLFDAIEDAAFKDVHDENDSGTLKQLAIKIMDENKQQLLSEKLKDFSVRMVLTAHPTQFYPGPVLGIINDLSKALIDNNTGQINMYLQQLGKTPFFKKQKPSPYDEAISLIWYLENIFYPAAGRIISYLKRQFPDAVHNDNPIIYMGFWPGGDRDGNPFVNTETTLKVADALRGAIIKSYYLEIRRLKRRLTFKGVENILNDLEKELYENIFIPGERTGLTKENILARLNEVKQIIIDEHDGLFLQLAETLINKVHVFGLHFASLDIRQESSVHSSVLHFIASKNSMIPADYINWDDDKRIEFLTTNTTTLTNNDQGDELITDTINSIKAIKTIQLHNGERGCNRYVISQCKSVLNVLEVYGLFVLCGWQKNEIRIDIIPLFETIDDLQRAAEIMRTLYSNAEYAKHLQQRNNRQTIMLGFSDGTKDGGYLMGNWAIYKAREELTAISKEFNIDIIFFDGRGGPPARGGGKTHNFYASMGKDISNKEIQLTIQGQTVSSNFGTIDSAQYNLEQLIHAGLYNYLFSNRAITFTPNEKDLLQHIANVSFTAYTELKDHPDFVDYLTHISPLRFYSETNIGSRPANRSGSKKISFKDLRAIPYVGAWSQLKQNVTGYYGVGTALKEIEQQGKFNEVKELYQSSLFFKTLLDNCEMAMQKTFFPLTAYLSSDKKYGKIWNMIYDEYLLTKEYLFKLSGKNELMSDYPVDQLSVKMRERMVLPLLTIQQFAITRIRQIEAKQQPAFKKDTFEKLIIRCSFGIINAGRNSV